MSRRGRQARMARLIQQGQWKSAADWSPPAPAGRPPAIGELAGQRILRRRLAERDAWAGTLGLLSWQQELTRRRGVRTAALRSQRLEREALSGKPPRKGPPFVPAFVELLDATARERLVARLTELEQDDRLIRQRSEQRPPDPPATLADLAAGTAA